MPFEVVSDAQVVVPAAANGISVTASGGAWTSGAYVELAASLAADSVLTGLTVRLTSGSGGNFLELDVSVGGAGSEVVKSTLRGIDAWGVGDQSYDGSNWIQTVIPVDAFPSGSRVAVRLRMNGGSMVYRVSGTFIQKPFASTFTTTANPIECVPAAATPTLFSGGGGAWTNGSWSQLRGASGSALALTAVGWYCNPAPPNGAAEVDIGVGGAGSETVVCTLAADVSQNDQHGNMYLPVPLNVIPAATRIAARVRGATASTSNHVNLMGVAVPL